MKVPLLSLAGLMGFAMWPAHADPLCPAFAELRMLAEMNSPTVAISRSETALARAERDEEGAAFKPYVSTFIKSRAGDQGLSTNQIENQVGLQVGQRLYDFGKTSLRQRAASEEVLRSEARLQGVTLESQLDVEAAYVEAAGEAIMLARLEEEEAYLSDLSKRLNSPALTSQVTISEQAEVNSRLADVRARQAVAFTRREDALLNIELQTGQKVTETCTLTELSRDVLLPEDFSFDLDEIIAAALNGDPAVQEADRAVGRVEAEQDLTRRQRLPDIDLVGTLSYVHLDNSREDWEYRDSLGISFSVPLYVGGSLNAQTRQATARAGRARAERDRLTRQLEQEIRSLARTYLSLQAQVNARRSAVGFKREQVASMEAAFAEGLQALRELVEAREELAEQQRFFDRALIDLHLTAVKFRRFLE